MPRSWSKIGPRVAVKILGTVVSVPAGGLCAASPASSTSRAGPPRPPAPSAGWPTPSPTAGPTTTGTSTCPAWAWPTAAYRSSGWPTASSRSATRTSSVWCVFNGEFFEYPEKRRELEAKGHRFRTHTRHGADPHLWEDHGEGMFDHLKGQFAFCVWDTRRNLLVLARDRFGICPLYWTVRRHGGRRTCCSPRRSGPCSPPGWCRPSRTCTASNHVFTFFAVPGPTTCFQGVKLLPPGHYLRVRLGGTDSAVEERTYWELDFPDRGHEEDPPERAGASTSTSGSSCSRSSAGCGRTCRSSRTCPAGSIRVGRGRGRQPGPRPADPDVHDGGPGQRASTSRPRQPRSPGTSARADRRRLRPREVRDTLPGADRGGRVPGGRHVVPRRCCDWPGGPRARVQGGPDRRGGRRVPGRLPVVQDPQAAELPGRGPGMRVGNRLRRSPCG